MIDKKAVIEKTDFAALYREAVQKFKITKPGQATSSLLFLKDGNPSLSSGAFNCFSRGPKNGLERLAQRTGIDTTSRKSGNPHIARTFTYSDTKGSGAIKTSGRLDHLFMSVETCAVKGGEAK